MRHFALILAGGAGERLSPLSTPERPKQFLTFYGGASLIQHTWRRVRKHFDSSQIYVATNKRYSALVFEQLPELEPNLVILESQKKNTAPCMALVSWLVFQRDRESVLSVFASDHYIGNEVRFAQAVSEGREGAGRTGKLVVGGTSPTRPATEYGYVRLKTGTAVPGTAVPGSIGLYGVEAFVEKPDEKTAARYVRERRYLWNCGPFFWKTRVMLGEVQEHLPRLYKQLETVIGQTGLPSQRALDQYFDTAEESSIDHGVFEKSRNVMVLTCDLDWSDLGSLEVLRTMAADGKVDLNKFAYP